MIDADNISIIHPPAKVNFDHEKNTQNKGYSPAPTVNYNKICEIPVKSDTSWMSNSIDHNLNPDNINYEIKTQKRQIFNERKEQKTLNNITSTTTNTSTNHVKLEQNNNKKITVLREKQVHTRKNSSQKKKSIKKQNFHNSEINFDDSNKENGNGNRSLRHYNGKYSDTQSEENDLNDFDGEFIINQKINIQPSKSSNSNNRTYMNDLRKRVKKRLETEFDSFEKRLDQEDKSHHSTLMYD